MSDISRILRDSAARLQKAVDLVIASTRLQARAEEIVKRLSP